MSTETTALIERLTAENARLREAIKSADEIITDSWGEDAMERGDCQAVNILRAALNDEWRLPE